MKNVTREASIRDEGTTKSLGTYTTVEFETIDEAVESFGTNVILSMINSSYANDVARVARNAFQKGDPDVQAEVDAYVPGQRKAKPSMAKLMTLVGELASAGKSEVVAEVVSLQASEGIEAAYNYALENK